MVDDKYATVNRWFSALDGFQHLGKLSIGIGVYEIGVLIYIPIYFSSEKMAFDPITWVYSTIDNGNNHTIHHTKTT